MSHGLIQKQRQGFTLVELLVVLGVIAALIALLLPALANARRASLQIKCSANLRSLGQAMMLHANEHQGYFPLAGHLKIPNDPTWWYYPQELDDSFMRKYDYFADNQNGNKLSLTALPMALAPYLGAQVVSGAVGSTNAITAIENAMATGVLRQVFACPADELNSVNYNMTAQQVNWVNPTAGGTNYTLLGPSSYGFNSNILGWGAAHGQTPPSGSKALPYWALRGHVVQCPHSSDTILFMDALGTASGDTGLELWCFGTRSSSVPGTTPPSSTKIYPGSNNQASLADLYFGTNDLGTGISVGSAVFDLPRHQGKVNILFVDGHVEALPILTTGASAAVGAIGTVGNTPSGFNSASPSTLYLGNGGLTGVSMNKDFQ